MRGPKKASKKLASTIAYNIRTIRTKKGLSQTELARRAGYLSPSAIGQIESSRAMPAIPKLYDLAFALNVRIRKILPNV
jgi:transcriptional regulator with XRE-family HTH domain